MAVKAELTAASVVAERYMVVVATAEVAYSWIVVATALVEVASIVDIGVKVVRLLATEESLPKRYFAVAILAVAGLVNMGLVVVAS